MRRQQWHVAGNHGRNRCPPAAGSPGDYSRLLAEIVILRRRIEELERRGKGKTPQNSSLPPSTQHPHAKPQPTETKIEEETRRSAGPRETRAAVDSHRRVRRRPTAEADRMPTLRREALGQRPGTAAASGVGIARDQAARDRIPAASAGVSLLRRDDVCRVARGRAAGSVGPAVDGLHRVVDGLLSSEQAADGRVSRARSWASRVARR